LHTSDISSYQRKFFSFAVAMRSSINPLLHTAGCETGWAIEDFAVNSSFLSVDGITCLIPCESWRNDLSNGIS